MKMNRRRLAIALLIALVVLLVLAPVALAAAGGGSSNFTGGGGGEGGGGGGGKGFAIYFIFRLIIDLILFTHGILRVIVFGLIALAILYAIFGRHIRAWWASRGSSGPAARRETAKRSRRVELAAAEAADEDPMFSPDHVRAAAGKLFTGIQAAWDRGDRTALRAMVAPELMTEWERRLDDFERRGWRNRVQPVGEPRIDYVGLSRRGRETEDRVVVRLEAKLRDYVEDLHGRRIKRAGRLTETVRIREFWTLGNQNGRWMLVSIEQGAEGQHALTDSVTPTPWSDEQALRDEALVEGAVAEAVPDGTSVAEVAVVDYQGDARAAALDLSLADGRFAPMVLEVAARRAVQAWAEAVDGKDRALLAIARPEAARALLHPDGQKTRLVVRGPQVRHLRIAALDAHSEPPTMTIDVELSGRRYLEDRDTAAVVSGSQSKATTFTERWTLALEGPDEQPWRIAQVGAPALKP
jgi:predicted lipid-binding transport protein (Tim44 family)